MDISSVSMAGFDPTMAMGMRGRPPMPPGDPAEMAAKIIEEEDADGDGMISVEETGMPEDMFTEIDADGDGLLTVEELEAHGEARQAEMESHMAEMAQSGDFSAIMSGNSDSISSLLDLLNQNGASDAYGSQNWISSLLQSDLSSLSLTG